MSKGSTIIDHRVVEMRFDNKEFESRTKQTLSTLSKLKEALKLPNSAKAFEDIDEASKKISFNGLVAGVEALNYRFSFLGESIRNIANNIRDSLLNSIKKPLDWVMDSIVSGGIKRAMNIENAHFQLQALLKDEVKVQAVMADAMEAVDGTAYAYDEAAKAASQFAASGIQSGEEMLGALKGITGVAAMTNSSFEDISNVFTTVAGNGRLMGDQLLQLSSRGLNAASTLADYFKEVRGQAGMTEGTIREMVSKGQISFKDFSDAMTWAFGDSAKRANETFTGAMSNMKSALARIGAGFISPLVEQNGELVQLFNALRIKIDDVKSALVFDEKTSAISGLSKDIDVMNETITRFTKEGTVSFETLTKNIFGASKSEWELAQTNEKLSDTFNKIKDNGKLTLDFMKDFDDAGLNTSVAIANYLNGITNGTIKASDAVKASVKEVTNGSIVLSSEIKRMTQEGKISFDIFTSSMVNSSNVVSKEAGFVKEVVTDLLDEVKKSGKVTGETLTEFNKSGIQAGVALSKYINGVSDGSIRATSAIKDTVDALVAEKKSVVELANEGKISYDVFQAAIENSYGDQKTLSKQFTDFFLDNVKKLVTAINEADMTKPMEVLYYGFESVKNVANGLLSVLSPLGRAFADVFLNFSGDDVINFAQAIERLTAKMKLSEKGSKNLHDAFGGVFSILKLLIDVGVKFLSIFIPINGPILDMGDGFLGLAGSLGRLLTKFSDGIRSSTLLKNAFNKLSNGIHKGINEFENLIKIVKDYLATFLHLEDGEQIISNLFKAFDNISFGDLPSIDSMTKGIKDFISTLANLAGININKISDALYKFFSIPMKNEGFAIFVKNFIQYVKDLKNAFKMTDDIAEDFNKGNLIGAISKYVENLRKALSFDSIYERVKGLMKVFNTFFDWIREKFGPSFEQLSVGSVIGAGGGVAIIYSFVKIAKAFSTLSGAFSKTITSIPGTLTAVKGALNGYQKDLKANALIKTAGAIAILAGALVLLSFTDPKRLLAAAGALSIVSGVIMVALAKLKESFSLGKDVNAALSTFAKGVSKTMSQLGRAVEFKALGSMIKDFAKAILLIGLTIVGLGVMYKKDKESLEAGVKLVEEIGLCLVAIMGMTVLISSVVKEKAFKNIGSIALSIVGVAASLLLIVGAMNKLFKMDFPADWQFKLKVLAGILTGLGSLAVVLGLASKIGGGNQLGSAGTILALAVFLSSTISALNKIFKMDLPSDYNTKIKILYNIFTAIAGLMVAIGLAGRLAGGTIKAAGTILSMCLFLATVVASLMVLSLMPTEKLVKGAEALGLILLTLGLSLVGASKNSSEDTWKTVLSMTAAIGAIIVGLSVLSNVEWPKLLTATLALGSVILAFSKCIDSIKDVSTDNKSLIAMGELIGTLIVISYALYKLAGQPWKNILSAGIAMSATFTAFAKTFQIIMKTELKKNTIEILSAFGALIALSIPIAVELAALAKQPWDSMLVAAAAMSTTLFAFANAYQLILKKNWSKNTPDKIAMFALMVMATIPLAIELGALASQPWENLLAATVSLSTLLIAMSGCMAVLTKVNTNVGAASEAALALDAFVVIVTGLVVVIGALFSQDLIPLEGALDKGIEILVKLGDGLGRVIGAIINGLSTQIASGLPQIATDLSQFMINLMPFIVLSKGVDAQSVACVGFLSAIIGALLVDEFINGIARLFNLHMADLGTELSEFMIALMPFIIGSKMIKPENAEAVASIGQMIESLTKSSIIDGIGRIFGLSGSLKDFGTELSEFGPSLVDFANSVKGITPDMVEGAAAAASIMAELANKLPGTDGLVQKVFGEKKSLSQFGSELLGFGIAIRMFAPMVQGITEDSVAGAAAAGSIMAELANKLPMTDSLWSKLFGNNMNLSQFGSELILFGPQILLFSKQVASVSPASVVGAAMATSIMSTIANGLPEAESWKSKIFGGTMSLSDFASELVDFGTKLVEFSNGLAGLNIILVASSIESFKNLIDLTNYAQNATPESLADFAYGLGNIGASGVTAFLDAFDNAYDGVVSSINRFVNQIVIAFQNKYGDYKKEGIESAAKYISGFPVKHAAAGVAGMNLAKAVLSAIEKMFPSFKLAGSNAADQFLLGFTSQSSKASLAASAMIGNTLAGLESMSAGFAIAGANAGQGFLSGLESKMDAISKAGSALGNAALNASKKALDEHSPSKAYAKVGDFAGLGFVNQLLTYVSKSASAGKDIGDASIKGIQSAINGMMDLIEDGQFNLSPTISPVVNLGDVRESASEISRLFNDAVKVTTIAADDISYIRKANKKSGSGSFGVNGNGGDTTITFNQNNYSPKSLSAVEIYRQTNNQIGMLKTRLKQK